MEFSWGSVLRAVGGMGSLARKKYFFEAYLRNIIKNICLFFGLICVGSESRAREKRLVGFARASTHLKSFRGLNTAP